MDFVKKEVLSVQIHGQSTSESHIPYQNIQLPLHVIEQIQLAVQNGVAVDPQLHSIIFKQANQALPTISSNYRNIVTVNNRQNSQFYDNIDKNCLIQNHVVNEVINNIMHDDLHHALAPIVDQRSKSVIIDHSNNMSTLQEHRVNVDNGLRLENRMESLEQPQRHLLDSHGGTYVQRKLQANEISISNGGVHSGVMRAVGGNGLTTGTEQTFPATLHIKSEQELEENPYFYEQMAQAYTGSENLEIDNTVVLSSEGHQLSRQSNTMQYVFNTQATNYPTVNVHTHFRQQIFQHYPSELQNNSDKAEYNVIKRTPTDLNHSKPQMHPNQQWGKSENDAGAHNKLPNQNVVVYKNVLDADYAIVKGEYTCVKCNGLFPSKRSMKQHAKNCSDENSGEEKTGRYACALCSYKCQSPAILKIHERTHTGEKPFSCTFCDYKSCQKNNVAKHILVHMKEKPFRCQYCDYRCAQKNNLVVHERTHTGDKPFACTLCEYKTVQKPNLVKHMYLHTGQKPYGCDVCNYRCVQKTNLTKHKLRHLNEKSGNKTVVRIDISHCTLCSFKTANKLALEKHVATAHRSESLALKDQNSIETESLSPVGLQICEQTKSSMNAHNQSSDHAEDQFILPDNSTTK